MFCTIKWLDPASNISKEAFQKVNNPNLLQVVSYGRAVAMMRHQTLRHGLIKIDGADAGYVQILEQGALANFLQAVILDRGPLWLEGYGTNQHFDAFVTALTKHYPRRPGRALRFIPEMETSDEVGKILKAHRLHKKSEGYQTILLDLTSDEQILRGNLKKNWRSSLQKAEKASVQVEWDRQGKYLDWLLALYGLDQKIKNYDGPSSELLKALSAQCIPSGDFMLGRAMFENRAIASVLLFCHGRGCTYQIGWNSSDGRALGAHNLLLWQAALELKTRGITVFDLGGVNDTRAKTVKSFKAGLGGRPITLPGLYTY